MNSSVKSKEFTFSPKSSLKRERPAFSSTADSLHKQSTSKGNLRHSTAETAASLSTRQDNKQRRSEFRPQLEERISISKSKQPPQKSSWLHSRDRVASYIAYDDHHSRMHGQTRQESSMFYLSRNLQSFGSWPVPKSVISKYQEAEKQNQDKFTVSQGLLAGLGYFYYSVNNVIFFVGLSQCLKKQRPTQPEQLIVENDVVKVMECRLSSSLVGRNDRNRVLIISHYQSVSFYLYHITDGRLCFQDLHQSVSLPGESITQIATGECGQLFYVDRYGELSVMFDQPVKRFLIFNTDNRQMVSNSLEPGYIKQIVQKYGEEGLTDGLKYIAKSLAYRWHRIRSKELACTSLEIDNRRKMVFTLVRKIFSDTSCEHTLCIYKLLENGVELWHCLSEQDLFHKLELFNLKLRRRQLQVHCIRAVDEQHFPDANLLLVTNNGSRIYLNITKEFIKPVRAMYAPDCESVEVMSGVASRHLHQINEQKVICDPTNDANLLTIAIKQEQALLIYAASSRILSYFCSRLDSKNRETLGEVPWEKFVLNASPNSDSVACWSLPSSTGMPFEIHKLLSDKLTEGGLPVTHTHELARQVYLPPDFYLVHNLEDSELLCHLRPIDIVSLWLSKLPYEECLSKLEQASTCWKRVEVVAMLYIAIADSTFDFYTTANLEQSIEHQTARRTDFSYIRQDRQIHNLQKLDVSAKQKAVRLVDSLGAKQEFLKGKDSDDDYDYFANSHITVTELQQCSTKEQALCLYTARLLRPVWNRRAEELSTQQTYTVSARLRDLLRFIDETPPDARLLSTKKKDGTRDFTVQEQLRGIVHRSMQLLGLIRTFTIQSTCEFHELLVQDTIFFETLLFTQLRRFEQKTARAYESDYSSLVGDKFVKIVSLYYKIIKAKDEKEVKAMCEDFGGLPSYFLDYLRIQRGAQTDTFRVDVIDKIDVPDSHRRRLLSTGTPSEQYTALLQMIDASRKATDRLRYINNAMDVAKSMINNKQQNPQTRSEYSLELIDLEKRKKVALVQLAMIDLVSEDGRNHGLVDALNQIETESEKLKDAVMKCDNSLVELIWYANFQPRREEYNLSAELERFVEARRPNGERTWPESIRRTLAFFFDHVVRGSNWILLKELVHQIEKVNLEVNRINLEHCLADSAFEKIDGANMFWLPELLLAEGFPLEDIYEVYSKTILELIRKPNVHSQNSPQHIEACYWLSSLRWLVAMVKLEPQLSQFRSLAQVLPLLTQQFIESESLHDRSGQELEMLKIWLRI